MVLHSHVQQITRLTLRRGWFWHIDAHIAISPVHQQFSPRTTQLSLDSAKKNTSRATHRGDFNRVRKITPSRRSICSPCHPRQSQKCFRATRSTLRPNCHTGSPSRTAAIRWSRSLRSIPRRQIYWPLASTFTATTEGTQWCLPPVYRNNQVQLQIQRSLLPPASSANQDKGNRPLRIFFNSIPNSIVVWSHLWSACT